MTERARAVRVFARVFGVLINCGWDEIRVRALLFIDEDEMNTVFHFDGRFGSVGR